MAKKNGGTNSGGAGGRGRTGKVRSSHGFEALLYQLLETELGGIQVYDAAIACAVNDELREEWEKYRSETENHIQIARNLLQKLGLDPDAEVAARMPVRHTGEALVKAIEIARTSGDADEAQLVAAECVVHAETKDHLNWELVGMLGEKMTGEEAAALREAHEEVEKEEDHHLYHTTGWTRELWLEACGMPAVLPPPEEEKHVETQIGAARAKNAREDLL